MVSWILRAARCSILFFMIEIWMGLSPTYGQEPIIPIGGKDLLPVDSAAAMQIGGSLFWAKVKAKIVPVEVRSIDNAWRVEIMEKPAQPWAVNLHVDLQGSINKGDILLVVFQMRCIETENESGEATIFVKVQQKSPPHLMAGAVSVGAGRAWKSFYYPFRAQQFLAQGQGNVSIHLGYGVQTLEFGGLRLINYGSDYNPLDLPMTKGSYEGQEPNAPWRKPAAQRIEQIRKANLSVHVLDAKGQVVPNAKVRVKMTRHAFGFGSEVYPMTFDNPSPDGQRYRDMIARYFNKAPLGHGFRWQNWLWSSPRGEKAIKDQLNRVLDWLSERRIEVRGHYLMWAPLSKETQPADLLNKPEALREALFAHIRDKSAIAGRRVQEWDAVNHIIGWDTRRYSDLLGDDIYAEVIHLGKQLNPHAEMWINEDNVLSAVLPSREDAYFEMARDLLDANAPLYGIGFMAHFVAGSLRPIEQIHKILNRFAGLGLPLQLTEFDVDVGFDEQFQADYLRDVMTITFAHPAVEAAVMWGFWEGTHWRPHAALWRKDWSIKPAGQAWLDLVFDQWWTDQQVITDSQGHCKVRGFLGEYEIEVQTDTGQSRATTVLNKAGKTVEIRLTEGDIRKNKMAKTRKKTGS